MPSTEILVAALLNTGLQAINAYLEYRANEGRPVSNEELLALIRSNRAATAGFVKEMRGDGQGE